MQKIVVSAKAFSDEIERVKVHIRTYEDGKSSSGTTQAEYAYWTGRLDTLMWISKMAE